MAQITVDIPVRVINSLCATGNYQGAQTPAARVVGATTRIKQLIRDDTLSYERPGTIQIATAALEADINSIVIT